jgi:hypothetical protein
MKKLIVKIAILLVSLNSYSQRWNGIPISGSFNTIKNNLIAKGFTLVTKEKNTSAFKGEINNINYEVYVYCTPITDQVAQLMIYLPKRTTWYKLKEDYNDIKDLFTEKYGIGTKYEFFDNPYYEGDGYEMSAVELEKCNYSAYWLNIINEPNMSLSVMISKYNQVKLTYENKVNMEKASDETKNINKRVF